MSETCSCGAALAPGARFCSQCGAPAQRRCAGCGAPLEPTHRFCAACGAPAGGQAAAPAAAPPPPPRVPDASGERRQVTVAYCDMVGSTALASRLDPEEMRAVIHLQRERCAAAVKAHEGRVLRHIGDGILVCFGYPEAHEDDAVRCVRAMLDLQSRIAEGRLRDRHPTEMRIGVATGLVVTGEVTEDAVESDLSVIGDAPNLAARLQALAPPGGVVVGSLTRRLIGDRFTLVDLGSQTVKGLDAPVSAALVTGEARGFRGQTRDAQRPRADTFAGRDWEAGLIADRWAAARVGRGQVVLISGEAGIGKSRLVETVIGECAEPRPNVLRLFCQTHYRNTAFSPLIEELDRRVSGRERTRPLDGRLKALRRVVGPKRAEDATALTLIAGLLGVETEGVLPRLGLTPQQVRARTQQLLLDLLPGALTRRPMVMVIEDCHWIDASSADLLQEAVDAVAELPVLVLATARPEFRPDWVDQPHVAALSLGKLDRDEAERIALAVAGKPLPPEVVAQIIARTDGVPLFVEELTNAVIESGQLRDAGDRYVLRESLPELSVPETLRDSLMARLDRLGAARRVAQIGAIIGREFRYDVLSLVADETPALLDAALDRLCESGLIARRGVIPEATFTFKHALVQDTAARSMLRRHRVAAHAAIAAVLRDRFPDLVRQRPELVAQHYERAGDWREALDHYERAGRAMVARSNYVEGISHLRSALAALKTGVEGGTEARPAPGPDFDAGERELNLLIALGGALIATRGYAAPEPGDVYARAAEICRRVHHGGIDGPIYYGLCIFRTVRAELHAAVEIARDFKAAAERQAGEDLQLVSTRTLGVTLTFSGEWEQAERLLQRTLDLYDPARHRDLGVTYAQDPRVSSLTLQSWCAFFSGRLDAAATIGRRAVEEAVELKHLHSLAYARGLAGAMLPQFRGDVAECRRGVEALLAATGRQPVPLWTGLAMTLQGWTIGANGDLDAGLRQLKEGVDEFTRTGARLFLPYYEALAADIFLRAGDRVEARRRLDAAEALMAERPEGWFAPELRRLSAANLLDADGLPDLDARHAALAACCDAALEGGHLLVALRAARDLCSVALDAGRDSAGEAARLRTILARFPKQGDPGDVSSARAVLARAEQSVKA